MTSIQIVSGTGGYLEEGTHAARPATPATPTGGIAIYYETDTTNTFLWDTAGAAWVEIAVGGSVGGTVTSVATGNGLKGGPITTTGTLSATVTSVTKTASYSVLAADSFVHFDDIGAAGTVTFTLPAAAAGLSFTFTEYTAHNMVLQAAGTDIINIGLSPSTAGGTQTAGGAYSSVTLEAHGTGIWVASAALGAWTPA